MYIPMEQMEVGSFTRPSLSLCVGGAGSRDYLLTSATGLVKLHKGLMGGSWLGCARIAPRGVAPGVVCNPQAWGQCGEPDALIKLLYLALSLAPRNPPKLLFAATGHIN